MYDLGTRIKDIRLQRGLTQKALALRINKSISAISSYETNVQMPPLDVLISIARAFNVTLDYLVGMDTGPTFTTKGFSDSQKEIFDLLINEFSLSPNPDNKLTANQLQILQKLILLFSAQQK